jgi:sulfopyruvate decarboxylase TPP-binding subunit
MLIVESLPAEMLHEEVMGLGISHLLTVPDTHQKSLLASLMKEPRLQTLTFSSEDEAICVNAGLWIGGVKALVMIQNVGLFASANALRGVAIDMRIPTCLLVGQYGRDVSLPVEDNRSSAVRLIEPMLDSLKVPHYRIDFAKDVGVLHEAFEQAQRDRGPVVVLIGAPTK